MGFLSSVGAALGLNGSYQEGKQRMYTNQEQKQWSDKVQQAVEDKFLNALNNDLNYGLTNQIANDLANLAYDYNIDIDVDAITNEARRQAQMQTGQNYQRLARQAGSDANSLVALAQNEAILDQESSLANLRAQLEMEEQKSQGLKLDALAQALDANNQANINILNLGQLLKGGQTTGTSLTKGNTSAWGLQFGMQGQPQNPPTITLGK